jgi:hypothetical protein
MSQLTRDMLEEMDFTEVQTIAPRSIDVSPAMKRIVTIRRRQFALGLVIGVACGLVTVAASILLESQTDEIMTQLVYAGHYEEIARPGPTLLSAVSETPDQAPAH